MLLWSWNFSGNSTGVGCYFLLQRILPPQGLNYHLLCLCIGRWILYHWAKSFSSLYAEWSIKQLGLLLWFSIAMHGIMLCKLPRKCSVTNYNKKFIWTKWHQNQKACHHTGVLGKKSTVFSVLYTTDSFWKRSFFILKAKFFHTGKASHSGETNKTYSVRLRQKISFKLSPFIDVTTTKPQEHQWLDTHVAPRCKDFSTFVLGFLLHLRLNNL